MNSIFLEAKKFKEKYPLTLAFRVDKHSNVAQSHLDQDETLKYVFVGQKNDGHIQFPNTFVFILTSKRMLLARKRLLFGYMFYAITPNMLNDVKVKSSIFWGKIVIDTVKELVTISNLSRNCLDEVETAITKYMIEKKDSSII